MGRMVNSLGLSLVDFMGALLPGLVWLILFITLGRMVGGSEDWRVINPVSTVQGLMGVEGRTLAGENACCEPAEREAHSKGKVINSREPKGKPRSGEKGVSDGGLALVIVLLTGLLLGYVVKPFVMDFTEWCTRLEAFSKKKEDRKSWRFPYNRVFKDDKNRLWFSNVERRVREVVGNWEQLPGHQPFSVCKRLLRRESPELWEELEYREAELRLLGSLYLASGFSTLLAVAQTVRCVLPGVWLFWSTITLVYLMFAFRRRRRREAGYAYLNFLVASCSGSEGGAGEVGASASGSPKS